MVRGGLRSRDLAARTGVWPNGSPGGLGMGSGGRRARELGIAFLLLLLGIFHRKEPRALTINQALVLDANFLY